MNRHRVVAAIQVSLSKNKQKNKNNNVNPRQNESKKQKKEIKKKKRRESQCFRWYLDQPLAIFHIRQQRHKTYDFNISLTYWIVWSP